MIRTGDFTLPGESGYEGLTLELAKRWGADVIRDSDGTALSNEILQAGYGIYSTICLIRGHNDWIKDHPETIQQTFLMAGPVVAQEETVKISLMENFYQEQFQVNDSIEAMKYWQAFDRTENKEVQWQYDSKAQAVILRECVPWHEYTVNFLAYRIWEEISMYNHVTNNWDKEHLIPIDPRYPQAREYLRGWMKQWCEAHPDTDVVRFTSMFYNFVWIWGRDERKRNLFTDWGSYDFTVSVQALQEFEEAYGYSMTSEDFINGGKLQVTHMPPNRKKKDWMEFTGDFVRRFGKELVEIVHSYGKKAYVFYDDSWVGIEPYNGKFREFGFDGIIKCVFSGYEVRMCAGVPADTHEIRLHPYLFPVGLGGKPTFTQGGHPEKDVMEYWVSVRRALLRQPVDRIGLGGYLHLTTEFPQFQQAIEEIAGQFRELKALHQEESPWRFQGKAAVLHSWGSLRPWTLSGHFHETYMHDLIHVNEALAGLPIDVDFISFKDVEEKSLEEYSVIINAGHAGDAWSGGDGWNSEVTAKLTRWVHEGGIFLGINEPSARRGQMHFFQMAEALGVDLDMGEYVCHGRWTYEVKKGNNLVTEGCVWKEGKNIFLTDPATRVFAEKDGLPVCTVHDFGKGKGVYLASFAYNPAYTRLLMNILLLAGEKAQVLSENPMTECAWFVNHKKIVVVNNTDKEQETRIECEGTYRLIHLKPYEMQVIDQ